MTKEQIEQIFTYHTPTPEQIVRMQEIRDAAKNLAMKIEKNVPDGDYKYNTIQKLHEVTMISNAAIILYDLI